MTDPDAHSERLKNDVLTWLGEKDTSRNRTSSGSETIGNAELVRKHLIEAARAGHSLTYSALLGKLGHGFTRPKMRALCKTLDAIDRDRTAGAPELAVLVVRQSDGLPGQGWWIGTAERHGYRGDWEGPAGMRFVEKLQDKVFAYFCEPKA